MHMLKKSFIATLLGMIVCLGLLVEPTFAWLTGRTEAAVSAVKSGELKAGLYWTDDFAQGSWRNAEETAIFTSEGWTPGKSEIRYLKVVNEGDHAFNYKFHLLPKGTYDELAGVIRLYERANVTGNVALGDLQKRLKLSTIQNSYLFSEGTLKKGESHFHAVALRMNNLVDETHRGKTLGDGFVIRVDAKQNVADAAYPDGTPTTYDNTAVESANSVEKPTADATTFVYDGNERTYTVASSECYTISGNTRTDAGTQTVTVALKDKEESTWADGTTDDVTFTFTIAQADNTWTTEPALANWTSGETPSTPMAAAQFGSWTVKYDGADEVPTTVGQHAAVFTVPESANYKGLTKEVQFEILSASAEKFALVFKNTDKYLYRVGNANTVALSSLFEPVNANAKARSADTAIDTANVSVSIEKLYEDTNVAGTFTANATDWTKGTIQFTGTGPVKLTITDGEDCTPTELMLEVVEAKNTTVSAHATASNIVLLNNISNASFNVSGGYTFYGNGFTVALSTNHVTKFKAGATGYITVLGTGGTLDNVKIVGPVYPECYVYRDQAKYTGEDDEEYCSYFRNSIILNAGDCKIYNSYISGSRVAVYVGGVSSAVIENSTISGGSFANVEVASSVTLKNVTTIQRELTDSYDKGKSVIGIGIVVDNLDIGKINIEGDLKQYNWVTREQWERLVPSAAQSALPKMFDDEMYAQYRHYRPNDSTTAYVNFALLCLNNWNADNINDNHVNAVTYRATDEEVSVMTETRHIGVYSIVNDGVLSDILFTVPDYVSSEYRPIAPSFSFDNSANADADDENDNSDPYCVYADGKLKIGLVGSGKTLNLSGVSVQKNGVALEYKAYLNGVLLTDSTARIDAGNGVLQTLVFTVTSDAGFDANGVRKEGEIEYRWEVPIEVATLSFPGPKWTISGLNDDGTCEFGVSDCLYAYYSKSTGYGEAVPIYKGISVSYYDKQGELVGFDFSNVTDEPVHADNNLATSFTYQNADGGILKMEYKSGFKSRATTYDFTKYNNLVYIYPQALDDDNYVRAGVGNQDFDVKVEYTFTDSHGQSIGPITVRWYNAAAGNKNVGTVQWKTFDSTDGKEYDDSGCVTPDTLITLADGSQVMVKDLKGDEELLVWNFFTGDFDKAPLLFINTHDQIEEMQKVVHLNFSDGTLVKIIAEHAFFDVTLNKYVYLDLHAADYIGHDFNKQVKDASGKLVNKSVRLVGVDIKEEVTKVYAPVTYGHLCCYVNGMLSLPGDIAGMFNYFAVDPVTMKYDAAAMQADIEKYGIFTYEEFAKLFYPSEFMYNAIGARYVNVTIGKGLTTVEKLKVLSDRYSKFFTK